MLMGAPRNALRAFNAGVSLSCLCILAHRLPHLFRGLVLSLTCLVGVPSCGLATGLWRTGRPAPHRQIVSVCLMLPKGFLCQGGVSPRYRQRRKVVFHSLRHSSTTYIGIYFSYIGKFENELTQLAEPTEEEIRQMREKIEEAQKEKSRAYHRNYSKEYRAKNLEKRREYERIKAREYRAKRKAQAAALPVS